MKRYPRTATAATLLQSPPTHSTGPCRLQAHFSYVLATGSFCRLLLFLSAVKAVIAIFNIEAKTGFILALYLVLRFPPDIHIVKCGHNHG